MGERHQVAVAEYLIQPRLDRGDLTAWLGLGRSGAKELPALVGSLLEVAFEQRVDPEPFGNQPTGEEFVVLAGFLAEPIGEAFTGHFAIFVLFLPEIDAAELLRVLDLNHPGRKPCFEHGVGQAVQSSDPAEEAVRRFIGFPEFGEQRERLILIRGRPGLREERT